VNTVLAHLMQGVRLLEVLSQNFEFAEAGSLPGSQDVLSFTIRQEGVLDGGAAAGCCVGSWVGPVKRVGGEIVICVAIAPVLI